MFTPTMEVKRLSDKPDSAFIRLFWRLSDAKADTETKRRVAALFAISSLGWITLFAFGILAWIEGNRPLAILDMVSALILLLNLIDAGIRRDYDFNIHAGVLFFYVIFTLLYAFGGSNNTGFLWLFTYPLFSCYFIGSKKGLIASVALTLPVVILMTFNEESAFFANYPHGFEIRFLCAYLLVSFFSYLLQTTREKNRSDLQTNYQFLDTEVKKRTAELNLANRKLLREAQARKKSAEALRISNESLMTMLNSIDATIYVADIDTYEIIFMNEYMVQAFGRDMTGEKCYRAFLGRDQPCEECGSDHILDKHGQPKGVYSWQAQNPITGRWYVYKDRAVRWIDGRLVHLQVAADITNYRRMEQHLQQAQKMESIGTLAGGIAHDFNNILFPIIGVSELLLTDLPRWSMEYENVQEILNAGKRGRDLVKQILAFSRKTEQQPIPVRIQKVLKEVLQLARSTIPTNIELNHQIQSDCGLVLADPTQIHQVCMNLITNAYHAVPSAAGRISVKLQEVSLTRGQTPCPSLATGRYAQLSVRDNGGGIAPDVINHIFEPYFTTKPQGKGTGLGLAVVYGIVKEYQGDISVASEPGRQTSFDIYLPLLKKSALAAPVDIPMHVATGSERILLVDDEASIVKLEAQMLERLGYRTTVFSSSLKALAFFRTQPDAVDLVLTDMSMPQMTGEELAERMLAVRPSLPIIICTGYSEGILPSTESGKGACEVMMKPIALSDLAQKVRQVLDHSPDRRHVH